MLRRVLGVWLVAVCAWPAAAVAAEPLRIDVLSNRADLISGGDALVEVERPAGAGVRVDVDGRDVSGAFHARGEDRLVGLVEDLAVGANEVTAELADGTRARLTITNHPIGGPIFTGPQVQPWVCNTQNPPNNSGTSPTVVPVGLGPPRDLPRTERYEKARVGAEARL